MKRFLSLLSLVVMASAPIAAQSGQTPPPSRPTNAPPSQPSQNAQGRQGQQGQQGNMPPGQNVQTPPAQQQGQQAPREQATSWQNIGLELRITDTGADTPKKTVSMLVLDGRSGQIRSSIHGGQINVDAAPTLRADGRIYLHLTIEYSADVSISAEGTQPARRDVALLNESLSLVVTEGKAVMASQSADARGDRKVTLELVATVIK